MNDSFARLLTLLPVERCGGAADYAALERTALGALLTPLHDVMQQPEWHGEGDVFTHTVMVCKRLLGLEGFWALELPARQALYLAALLHDVGKTPCTRLEDGVWRAPRHGQVGSSMVRRLLMTEYELGADRSEISLRETICLLVRYHMIPEHALERESPERLLRSIAADGELAEGFTLRMLCLLAEADCLGRIADDTQELAQSVHLCAELAMECGCYDGPYAFPTAHVQHAYLCGRGVMPDQQLFDDTWSRVVMLCGLPGTGKDTYIAAHYPDWPMLSLDEIRRAMRIAPEDDQGRVAQEAKERAKEYLRKRRPFVFNATNLTDDLRGKWLRLFEQYGAATEILYLETGWKERCRRNKNRKYDVPEQAVAHMLDKLVPPARSEGTHVSWLSV
ncbi:MAG: AAA family ATPase [Clostridia bacterium]|nr:AAA family ATPase [Clostridia bacterium]